MKHILTILLLLFTLVPFSVDAQGVPQRVRSLLIKEVGQDYVSWELEIVPLQQNEEGELTVTIKKGAVPPFIPVKTITKSPTTQFIGEQTTGLEVSSSYIIEISYTVRELYGSIVQTTRNRYQFGMTGNFKTLSSVEGSSRVVNVLFTTGTSSVEKEIGSPGGSSGSVSSGGTPAAGDIRALRERNRRPYQALIGGTFTVDPQSLAEYLNLFFNIFFGICTVLVLFQFIYAGVEIMGSESVFKKNDGKERIKRALIGLLIALSSYLILNTINPDLVNVDLRIRGINISLGEGDVVPYDLQNPPKDVKVSCRVKPDINEGCPTCRNVKSEIAFKPGTGKQFNATYAARLEKFYDETKKAGIAWTVTEGYVPPRAIHCSQCHYNGSCADIRLEGTITAANIKKFQEIALANNLFAVWEQKTGENVQRENELKKAGLEVYTSPHVTGSHFSLYCGTSKNKRCP